MDCVGFDFVLWIRSSSYLVDYHSRKSSSSLNSGWDCCILFLDYRDSATILALLLAVLVVVSIKVVFLSFVHVVRVNHHNILSSLSHNGHHYKPIHVISLLYKKYLVRFRCLKIKEYGCCTLVLYYIFLLVLFLHVGSRSIWHDHYLSYDHVPLLWSVVAYHVFICFLVVL